MSNVKYLHPILSAVDLNVFSLRPEINTDAPSETNLVAIAAPSPFPPPVTIIFLPDKRPPG